MIARNPWWRASMAAWSLGIESSTVIMLRTMRIAAGGAAAQREAEKMVGEKIEAALDLHTKAMTGALGIRPETATNRTLSHYRRKVRANRRRLLKG